MTAVLSPKFDQSFERADVRNTFFSQRELDFIEKLEQREIVPKGEPSVSCNTNLFFGFFFDGTRNNYMKAEPVKTHSNVARLYDCFPGQSVEGVLPDETKWKNNPDQYSHFFRVYIPGVASPFKEVKDSGTGFWDETLGAGAGRKANERIVWALVQAINNVHRYFFGQPLVSPPEATALATRLELSKEGRHAMTGAKPAEDQQITPIDAPRIEFEKLLRRLHANVSQHWKKNGAPPAKLNPGIVGTIYISTFGFSRGSTQARAFANWLDSLCRLDAMIRGEGSLSLGGFPVSFDFMGIFDTVASVGLAATMSDFWMFKEADGHGAWADAEDSLRVPASMKRCLHLVAGHELRRSFPLDSVSVGFTVPDGSEEIVFPGVHSDVGGGYMPKEHGKGTDANGTDMLSRLPLLFMYKQARLAGVPLKLELAADVVKERFAVSAQTIKDFNAYLDKCTNKSGRITDIMREQAVLQMAWRHTRRIGGAAPLEERENFSRASTFDKNDLHSSNEEFTNELKEFEKWLAARGGRPTMKQEPGFKKSAELEWEELATVWPLQTPPKEVLHFFDEYVHDSRAAFKLKGADTEKGAIEQVQKWSRLLKIAKRRYESGFDRNSSFNEPPDYGLPTNARMAAEDYDKTQQLPRYLVEGREPFGRARAGYFRFRRVYGGSDNVLLSNWRPPQMNDRMLASTKDAPADAEKVPPRAA